MKNEKLRFSVILLFGLTVGFVFLDRQAISFLFPALVQQFGLNNAQVGQIGMVQTLGFAIFALLFSIIADRIGRKPAASLFAVLAAIPFAALYLTCGPVAKILVVVLGGTLMGFTNLHIAIISVESVPVHMRTTASAFVIATGEIAGGALAPRIVGGLADGYGLPVVMLAAVCCLATALVMTFFLLETNPCTVGRVSPVMEGGLG